MILVYDTETDGLPKANYPDDHEVQPWLVQLGAVLVEDDGREVSVVDLTVDPGRDRVIPEEAARCHGITTALARARGVPLAVAVAVFTNLRAKAALVVAHNLPFDQQIMRTALLRCNAKPRHLGPERMVCTMTLAEPILRLPPTEKQKKWRKDALYKAPSLGECHKHLFGVDLVGAHSALVDARACARVYFELMRRVETRSKELEACGG